MYVQVTQDEDGDWVTVTIPIPRESIKVYDSQWCEIPDGWRKLHEVDEQPEDPPDRTAIEFESIGPPTWALVTIAVGLFGIAVALAIVLGVAAAASGVL